MLFALLTLLTSLSLAGVVGWFSIVGVMTIYAGAPLYSALLMGVVMECSKLVTLSWLYRNWQQANLFFKIPLIIIAMVIMIITNIGVFGFLSKAHLEQGASTVDNTAKVEQIVQQINREKSNIADNEKIITQMDGAVNSLIGKDQATRSLSVRKGQASQRKQLRDDITTSQKQIDTYNQEKFILESEVRKLQLEVGPIRYISEIFYGDGNTSKNMESAIQIFTLLIVLILDPAAVMLLLAANHSLARLKDENKKKKDVGSGTSTISEHSTLANEDRSGDDIELPKIEGHIPDNISTIYSGRISESQIIEIPDEIQQSNQINETEEVILSSDVHTINDGVVEKTTEDNVRQSLVQDKEEPDQTGINEIQNNEIQDSSGLTAENEKAILARFGSLEEHKWPLVSPAIFQPRITRVEQGIANEIETQKKTTIVENSMDDSNDAELHVETTTLSEKVTENLQRAHENKVWHWSKFSDGPAPSHNKIKTMSWLKEFGKE